MTRTPRLCSRPLAALLGCLVVACIVTVSFLAAGTGEKQVRINFTVSKNGLTGQTVVSTNENLTGSAIGPLTQTIPTNAWTAINIGACSSADLMALKNQDPTNSVQLSATNTGFAIFANLTPGRVAFFPPDVSTIYAKAHQNTGGSATGVVLQSLIVEP